MRNDSADAFDSRVDVEPIDVPTATEAEALAAIHASWQDETERTDVMRPQHLASHFATASRSERARDETTRHVNPPPRAVDDPHWDDEGELTNALDLDRLAPWHPPSENSDGDPAWEVAVTNRIDPVTASTYEAAVAAAAASGKRAGPVPPADRSPDLSWLDDMLSPAETPAPAPRTISSVRDLSIAVDPTPSPTPGLLEAAPWPARSTRSLPAARPTARSERPVARKTAKPPARIEQANAQPAYESQAVRKSQVARARLDRPVARPASVPPLPLSPARSQRPRAPAARASVPALQPSAAGGRIGAATLPARGRTEPVQVAPPPAPVLAAPPSPAPAWLTQSRAPAPMFNLPPLAAEVVEYDPPVRPSRVGASWLWLSAGAAAAVVLAIGFRLWTEVTAGLQPVAPEVSTSAATAPIRSEETGFAITSRPAGAQVHVDGKPTGLITPARVRRLTPGLHAVDLKLPGYFDTSLPAVLEDGATLELSEVELRPLAATDPSPVAAQPLDSEPQLKAAKKSRRYRARRHARQEIASIENTPLGRAPAAEATPAPEAESVAASGEGVLQINSRPWARVLIDDKFVGNTPQRALRVPAGRHVVQLVNEPLNMSKTFTIEVRDGETITKVETLVEQPTQSGATRSQPDESAVAQVLQMRVD